MPRLQLSLACWDYDRTRALADGSVRPEGIDLVYQNLYVEETFFRMLRNREFDAAEMSLSSYCVSLMREEPAFVAIPVFPSRFFRHSCIFVSAKSGIREPKDLAGKKTGVPEYQMTAPVWIRGILQAEVHRTEADARADDRRRRARRDAHRAHALDLRGAARNRQAPVRGLRRSREGVLPKDENFPDHAHSRSPPRAVPGEPLDRAVALQGFRAGAAQDLRNPSHHHGAHHDAALAGRACRGGAAGARRGLVALRLRAQPPRARDVPALSPRAGAIEAAAESGGAFRAGDAQVFPGLISCSAVRNPIGK